MGIHVQTTLYEAQFCMAWSAGKLSLHVVNEKQFFTSTQPQPTSKLYQDPFVTWGVGFFFHSYDPSLAFSYCHPL